jgi:four helix bundle protein
MNLDTWLKLVPASLSGDPLWKVEAYRLALFASDIGWRDVTKLAADRRTLDVSNQTYRALGSIGANLAEGYSRGGGRDRARFYEYALGSAREARSWYFNGRLVLGDAVTQHRMDLLTQITRLLLTIVPDQRDVSFREEPVPYAADLQDTDPFNRQELEKLVQDVPMS